MLFWRRKQNVRDLYFVAAERLPKDRQLSSVDYNRAIGEAYDLHAHLHATLERTNRRRSRPTPFDMLAEFIGELMSHDHKHGPHIDAAKNEHGVHDQHKVKAIARAALDDPSLHQEPLTQFPASVLCSDGKTRQGVVNTFFTGPQ